MGHHHHVRLVGERGGEGEIRGVDQHEDADLDTDPLLLRYMPDEVREHDHHGVVRNHHPEHQADSHQSSQHRDLAVRQEQQSVSQRVRQSTVRHSASHAEGGGDGEQHGPVHAVVAFRHRQGVQGPDRQDAHDDGDVGEGGNLQSSAAHHGAQAQHSADSLEEPRGTLATLADRPRDPSHHRKGLLILRLAIRLRRGLHQQHVPLGYGVDVALVQEQGEFRLGAHADHRAPQGGLQLAGELAVVFHGGGGLRPNSILHPVRGDHTLEQPQPTAFKSVPDRPGPPPLQLLPRRR
mmetsp:Transcript_59255/g.158594  ORF Transcript_59255/g.158594 Transcript_59255/m.158594 type:complete len:293 (+) Transcript_59255:186-1064(+)